jgi:hypothetical protein
MNRHGGSGAEPDAAKARDDTRVSNRGRPRATPGAGDPHGDCQLGRTQARAARRLRRNGCSAPPKLSERAPRMTRPAIEAPVKTS